MYKIIKKLIDDSLEGVDVYYHNGGIWFIFTEAKQWVLEIEKNGNLWYNYSFFKNLFYYLSMDVIENQEYITRYVEDVIQNGVKNTLIYLHRSPFQVEDVIQNGVKNTGLQRKPLQHHVEDVIQNGIKETKSEVATREWKAEEVIDNGVKIIRHKTHHYLTEVANTLKDGIKEVKELPDMSGEFRGYGDYYRKQKDMAKPHVLYVKDVIEKGFKLK